MPQDNEQTVAAQSNETEQETTRVIEVANPTAEEMVEIRQTIKANYDFNVSVKPVKFNFKKSVDKDTGIETIRKPVELAVPYPSVEGVVSIIETGGKGLELLLEAMEAVVNSAARDILSDDGGYDLTAATFPVEQVSWEHIAHLPKAQRKGGGIPKETWEAFGSDYIAVMPDATGKTVEQVANAAKLLVNKFSSIKTNKPVISLLVDMLTVYAENSECYEEYAECVTFLASKAETLLADDGKDLLANL